MCKMSMWPSSKNLPKLPDDQKLPPAHRGLDLAHTSHYQTMIKLKTLKEFTYVNHFGLCREIVSLIWRSGGWVCE